MNISKIFEGPGAISKRETLATTDCDQRQNVLALESLHPFPGYHGEELPYHDCPISLFLPTRNRYLSEDILRSSQKIRKDFPYDFNVAPAIIYVFNERTYAIRIKDIQYDHIGDLVKAFKDHDILFMKRANIKSYSSIIKLKKFFIIEEIAPEIYKDKEWDGMYYLKINDIMPWDIFEEITVDLKNNMDDNNFDAATAMMSTRNGLHDFIRIYDQNTSIKKLQLIHSKYINAVKLYQFI